jgi:hypothetical protein
VRYVIYIYVVSRLRVKYSEGVSWGVVVRSAKVCVRETAIYCTEFILSCLLNVRSIATYLCSTQSC